MDFQKPEMKSCNEFGVQNYTLTKVLLALSSVIVSYSICYKLNLIDHSNSEHSDFIFQETLILIFNVRFVASLAIMCSIYALKQLF